MDLKQSAEIRTYIDKDGHEQVRDIVLKNVRFNYTWLVSPQEPDSIGKTPNYSTNLVIHDQETWNTFAAFFGHVYEKAVTDTWGNKRPDYNTPGKMNLPFFVPQPKDDGTWGDFEEGAIAVIKARTTQQPELFIRLGGEPIRQVQTEEDLEEIYSGMIGDAVITLWAYDSSRGGSPRPGIRAFIVGACKTDHGDPILFNRNNYDLLGAFGGEGSTAAAFTQPKTQQPVQVQPQGVSTTPNVVPPQPQQPAQPKQNLSQLLGGKTGTITPPKATTPQTPTPPTTPNILTPNPAVQPIEQEPEAPKANMLQDLINKGLTK